MNKTRAAAFSLAGAALATLAMPMPAFAAGPDTQLVSQTYTGAPANDFADRPQMSGNGRFVTFDSRATNLTPQSTTEPSGAREVYERDLQTGTTTLVSQTVGGSAAQKFSSYSWPSDDGHLVAFTSDATNLTIPATARRSVFVRNMTTGITENAALNSSGQPANRAATRSMLSGTGRFISFNTPASNMTSTPTNNKDQVYLRDLQTGTTTLVSVSTDGVAGNDFSYRGLMSDDGRYVVFDSVATNLVPGDTNGKEDVFLRDLVAGMTTRISVTSTGAQSGGGGARPYLSPDGRYVVFNTYTSLVPEDNNTKSDVYVYDTTTGKLTDASVGYNGAPASSDSLRGFITDDGRYVFFNSYSNNLTKNKDTNGHGDVYMRDLQTGVTTLVSLSWYGGQANGTSYRPVPSADGSVVTYQSNAHNLVQNDPSNTTDWQIYAVHTSSLIPGGDQQPPSVTITSPAKGSTVSSPVQFSGTASDNVGVDHVQIAIRDNNTLKWLQADGSWGSTQTWRRATLSNQYAESTSWQLGVDLPPGSYGFSTNAFDTANNQLATKPWTGFRVA